MKAAMIASTPTAYSRSAKLRLTGTSNPSQLAATTAAIASASKPMIIGGLSAARSAITQAVESTSAVTPGSNGARDLCPASCIRSDPFADLFLDQPGRAPSHEYDHNDEGKHVLIGTAKGQCDGAD